MKNVIILNLKSVFLPEPVLQLDRNSSFVEKSIQKDIDNIPYFDPLAVKEIQKMIDATNAEIVVSDGWFWTKGFEITKHWCEKNGLSIKFHENYATPKKISSMRINEIQWWIEQNPNDEVILILDENYSMRKLPASAKEEQNGYNNYLNKYKNILGVKRRKSLIPVMEYRNYENFKPLYGIEANRTVCITEEYGLTQNVINEAWEIIKKAT